MLRSQTCSTIDSSSLFHLPLQAASAADVLTYFQTRSDVSYFALRDAEQASPQQIQSVLQNRFRYNDETYDLPLNFDWTQNPSDDIEWQILLHKFYFAPGLGEEYITTRDPRYAQKWIELTAAWIDTVALDFLPCDVMGRRVQSWIFAHYYFINEQFHTDASGAEIDPDFYLKFLHSLHAQVNYLGEHLTPKRNHRTIELYAIFMAAVVFPEFTDAEGWLNFSRAELVKNIQDDLRSDGVHCEQSTDYHHLVVKNYLGVKRLAMLNQIELPAVFDDLLQSALDFAMFAHKPDGDIPSLSDGDSHSFLELLHLGFQLYRNPEWLYVATQGQDGVRPNQRSRHFPTGGYTILRSGWGSATTSFTDEQYLIFDCGPLGEGNHGHLDLLNFELAAFGQSLLVDPGRYTYHEPHPDSGEVNWRVRFRGTGYHNTVQVDGQEQTCYEFYKRKFKIRGPEPEWTLHDFCSGHNFDFVHGEARSHEYNAIHERIIFFVDSRYWIITDILRSDDEHQYDLRFHLSDAVQERLFFKEGIGATFVDGPNLRLAQPQDPSTTTTIEEGFVSRVYGVKHAAPVVRSTRRAKETVFHTVLYPHQTHTPAIHLDVLPVERDGQPYPAVDASALRLSFAHHGKTWTDTFLHARQSEPASASCYMADNIAYSGSPLVVRRTYRDRPQIFGRAGAAHAIDDVSVSDMEVYP